MCSRKEGTEEGVAALEGAEETGLPIQLRSESPASEPSMSPSMSSSDCGALSMAPRLRSVVRGRVTV